MRRASAAALCSLRALLRMCLSLPEDGQVARHVHGPPCMPYPRRCSARGLGGCWHEWNLPPRGSPAPAPLAQVQPSIPTPSTQRKLPGHPGTHRLIFPDPSSESLIVLAITQRVLQWHTSALDSQLWRLSLKWSESFACGSREWCCASITVLTFCALWWLTSWGALLAGRDAPFQEANS